jgi:hypothetical protein
MKHTLLIIALLVVHNYCFSQTQNKGKGTHKLEIKIKKNVELLGLAYFIGFEGVNIENKTVDIDGKKVPKKDWHNYGYKIYQEYKGYGTSENLARCFSVADHLWLDYLTAFLLQVEDVPNAKFPNDIKQGYYLNFSKGKNPEEAKKNATIFLDGLNAFAKEIEFQSHLNEAKPYYDQVVQEVENGIPDARFIEEMESFYKQSFDAYLLVPSLTIPKGMGFGIKNSGKNETTVFNVFGALDYQEFDDTKKLNMGFAHTSKLRELSVHEFGHSFVNPVIDQLPPELFIKTAYLFEPLQSAMADQGYNTWKVCAYEHFVRAGEIMIADKLGDKETANKILYDYKKKRQFDYIPDILEQLKKYDSGEYESYVQTVRSTMEKLSLK